MHSSFFNYNVQRPYPFRWFTPVAVTGAIVLLILLSIMNFVQNSYQLIVEYVDNPNSTITHGVWFENWPSYLTSSVRPTCQPANLPVNTQFFTNQSGLMWTITNIFDANSTSQALPSLPYLNNQIDDCVVAEIQMQFDSTRDLPVSVLQVASWNIEVRAFVTCGISGPTGHTMFNLTAVYNVETAYNIAGTTTFVARDATGRASIYWSEALLSAYWRQAVWAIFSIDSEIKPYIGKGFVNLFPSTSETNLTSLDFFNMQYDFLSRGSGYGYAGTLASVAYYVGLKYNDTADPQIWTEVDNLAKAMFSAVVSDLGQTQHGPTSNLVSSASTLEEWTAGFHSILINATMPYGLMMENQSYSERQSSHNPTGALGLSPSVIATKYLCQVPRLRPIGDIFISVFLADLVLLQGAWRLYTFLVDKLLLRKQPHVMHCEGCFEDEEEIEKFKNELAAQKHGARSIVRSLRIGSLEPRGRLGSIANAARV